MAWQIHRFGGTPIQRTVSIVNDDNTATPTTDYHKADALARKALGDASLLAKGYQPFSGNAMRVYISQAY